jgi:DNA-binding NarL/FixJ family response regulator
MIAWHFKNSDICKYLQNKTRPNMIKIAIVEDNEDVRKLTASLLNQFSDIECVGSFDSAEAFSAAAPNLQADVVLMDIGLPKQNGIECVRENAVKYPHLEFIMFTDHSDSAQVFSALLAGANGYVLKGGLIEQLAEGIRDIKAGGSPMSRQFARLSLTYLREAKKDYPELELLSKQEHEVLEGLYKGWSYKEIATHRFVSEHTVRTQVRSIYYKLQVHTRAELIHKFPQ